MLALIANFFRNVFAARMVATILAAHAAAGCSTTVAKHPDVAARHPDGAPRLALPVAESGFLTDYARLKPSAQSPDVLFWRDPGLNHGFRRILFRPVQVWRGADARLEDIPETDLQYLADSFYRAMTTRLRQSFELVEKASDGVLEIQLALTLVTRLGQRVDFYSTDVPVRHLPERTRALGAATKTFVRECAFEAEFAVAARAQKGEKRKRPRRIVEAAIFDKRRGSDTSKGTVETWSNVDAVFDRWSEVLDSQLVDLKDGTFKPKLTVAPGAASTLPKGGGSND